VNIQRVEHQRVTAGADRNAGEHISMRIGQRRR